MNRADIEQKILKSIPNQKRVRLHLAPRFGKTKLMIQVIQRDDPQTILGKRTFLVNPKSV